MTPEQDRINQLEAQLIDARNEADVLRSEHDMMTFRAELFMEQLNNCLLIFKSLDGLTPLQNATVTQVLSFLKTDAAFLEASSRESLRKLAEVMPEMDVPCPYENLAAIREEYARVGPLSVKPGEPTRTTLARAVAKQMNAGL